MHLLQAGGLTIPTSLVLLPSPNQPPSPPNSSNPNPEKFYAPDYVFLIEHVPSKSHYLFDLGMRKDLEKLPPTLQENVLLQFECFPESPAEILREWGSESKGQRPEDVEAVILSHAHFGE